MPCWRHAVSGRRGRRLHNSLLRWPGDKKHCPDANFRPDDISGTAIPEPDVKSWRVSALRELQPRRSRRHPAPATMALIGIGVLGGAIGYRRRRRDIEAPTDALPDFSVASCSPWKCQRVPSPCHRGESGTLRVSRAHGVVPVFRQLPKGVDRRLTSSCRALPHRAGALEHRKNSDVLQPRRSPVRSPMRGKGNTDMRVGKRGPIVIPRRPSGHGGHAE
jgi:hypothetical protein